MIVVRECHCWYLACLLVCVVCQWRWWWTVAVYLAVNWVQTSPDWWKTKTGVTFIICTRGCVLLQLLLADLCCWVCYVSQPLHRHEQRVNGCSTQTVPWPLQSSCHWVQVLTFLKVPQTHGVARKVLVPADNGPKQPVHSKKVHHKHRRMRQWHLRKHKHKWTIFHWRIPRSEHVDNQKNLQHGQTPSQKHDHVSEQVDSGHFAEVLGQFGNDSDCWLDFPRREKHEWEDNQVKCHQDVSERQNVGHLLVKDAACCYWVSWNRFERSEFI